MTQTQTYQATYSDGTRATVRDDSQAQAKRRLLMVGRGLRIRTLKAVGEKAFAVWGKDSDDCYEDA